MSCPLCRTRRARRVCPALGQDICAVCCGTKRLVEIACPETCPYLVSAREHPPAVTIRQQQDDMVVIGRVARDLDRQQAALFFLACTSIRRHLPAVLQPLIDEDVAEASGALASTFETAERGVIYEHRPSSLPAERLLATLKATFAEAGKGSGASFGRDAGLVLRRIEEAVRAMHSHRPGNRRAFLDLLGRILQRAEQAAPEGPDGASPSAESPLIVP